MRGSYESIASKHIKKQFKSFSNKATKHSWDGMSGDNIEDVESDFFWDGLLDAGSGKLGITKATNESGDIINHASGFMSAKDTLEKYEVSSLSFKKTKLLFYSLTLFYIYCCNCKAMELGSGKKTGFVTFKAKGKSKQPIRKKLLETEEVEDRATSFIEIPQHLRDKLPDPLDSSSHKESKNDEKRKSSKELSSDVDRLKAELKALKEKRKQSLDKRVKNENSAHQTSSNIVRAQTDNTSNATSNPLTAPPPISFRRRRHKVKKKN